MKNKVSWMDTQSKWSLIFDRDKFIAGNRMATYSFQTCLVGWLAGELVYAVTGWHCSAMQCKCNASISKYQTKPHEEEREEN